ncbi:MAG: RNA polymerase sigma factor RpoD/SigA [Treponema sp.]|jgi:RNA polymerase primary sigma factor|nr:RNA polymerase sigma factor RpoD/SigA [Treponema sp.]
MKRTDEDDGSIRFYFSRIKTIPLLTFEEEQRFSRLIQEGDKTALGRLVEANLRLVVKIARAYISRDFSLQDLIQEGNLGLIRAAEKYDFKKNVRFSTYAAWWIRQSINRYLSNRRRTIRLPQRKEEILRKIQRCYHHLSQTLGRQPKIEDISREIGVPPRDIDCILNMTNGILSLDLEASGEESAAIMDLHEDYTYSPEQALLRKSSRDETIRFLDRLKDREKRILMYRYQLNGGERYTLKKISEKMGISPETVRQIEMKALRKIRSQAEELRSCMYAT